MCSVLRRAKPSHESAPNVIADAVPPPPLNPKSGIYFSFLPSPCQREDLTQFPSLPSDNQSNKDFEIASR
jgi:hypothetical protein